MSQWKNGIVSICQWILTQIRMYAFYRVIYCMSNNHVINTHAFYLLMIMVILVTVPFALTEPPQEKVTMTIVDWWWMKSYQMWPWLATRGFWISGDIVIISAILLPFHPLSYQVICLPVTTIATHTFIESIISSHVKSKNVRCNFAFIYSSIFSGFGVDKIHFMIY